MAPSRTQPDRSRFEPASTHGRSSRPPAAQTYQREHGAPPETFWAQPERRHERMELAVRHSTAIASLGIAKNKPTLKDLFHYAYMQEPKSITSFVDEAGCYYSSPTSIVLSGLPPNHDRVEFLEPCWANVDAIYAPLFPKDPSQIPTDDPVMSPWTMHMRADELIEETENGHFRAKLADTWKQHESELVQAYERLLGSLNKVFDLSMLKVKRPSDMADYMAWQTSKHDAMREAYLAITGGLALTSMLTLLITNLWAVRRDRDSWIRTLTGRTSGHGHNGLKPEFIDALKSSLLNDFEASRVGVFIDLRTCPRAYLDWVPGMILANVPVIFRWAKTKDDYKVPAGLEWVHGTITPNPQQARPADPMTRGLPMVVPTTSRRHDPHLERQMKRPDGSDFRRVRPREIRRGKTLYEYFSHRFDVQRLALSNATRREREWFRLNQQYSIDRKFGAEWDDVAVWTQDTLTGMWKVVVVPKLENGAVLKSQPAPWRRYDSIVARWDCAKFWDPDFDKAGKAWTFTAPWWGGGDNFVAPTFVMYDVNVLAEQRWKAERIKRSEGLVWTLKDVESLRETWELPAGPEITGATVTTTSDGDELAVIAELFLSVPPEDAPADEPLDDEYRMDEDAPSLSSVNKSLQVLDPSDFVYTPAQVILSSRLGFVDYPSVDKIEVILSALPKNAIKTLDDVWQTLLGGDLRPKKRDGAQDGLALLRQDAMEVGWEETSAAKAICFVARLVAFGSAIGESQGTTTATLADNAIAPSPREWALAPGNWSATWAQMPGLHFWSVSRVKPMEGRVTMPTKAGRRYWQLKNKAINDQQPVLIADAPFLIEILRSGRWTSTTSLITERVFSGGECYAPQDRRYLQASEAYRNRQLPRRMQERRVSPHLGYREENHRFTVSEYKEYERIIRARFAKQHHLARACLQAGGILWRLAMEVVCPDFVFRGPSNDACDLDVGFTVIGHDRQVLIDDDISEAEHDAAIGTYLHAVAGGRVDAQPSWWPTDSQFKSGSLWTGAWTSEAERWYQGMRKQYLTEKDGAASLQPRTGRKWRDHLRNRCKTARLVCTAALFQGEQFLDSHIE